MPPLILASSSTIRAALLRNAGLMVEVIPARIDEIALTASLQAEGATPHDIADTLAEHKALRVAARHPDRLVLGCDQLLECDGVLFSKPESPEHAAGQLRALRGRTHRLHTAAVLFHGGRPVWRHVSTPRLTMPDLTAPGLTTPGLTTPGAAPAMLPSLTDPALTNPGLTAPQVGLDPALTSPTGIGLPTELPISTPLSPGAGTYPILGDPAIGLPAAPAPASGGIIGDLSSAANQLGVGQAIDLLKGIVVPGLQQAMQNAAAPAAAAAPVVEAAGAAGDAGAGEGGIAGGGRAGVGAIRGGCCGAGWGDE
jgi:predicted house-cleaning NTP pyrophosphatase (Maf/HAM1 superfamily)